MAVGGGRGAETLDDGKHRSTTGETLEGVGCKHIHSKAQPANAGSRVVDRKVAQDVALHTHMHASNMRQRGIHCFTSVHHAAIAIMQKFAFHVVAECSIACEGDAHTNDP